MLAVGAEVVVVGAELAVMGKVVVVEPVVVEVLTTVVGTTGAEGAVDVVVVAADVEAVEVGTGASGIWRGLFMDLSELNGV